MGARGEVEGKVPGNFALQKFHAMLGICEIIYVTCVHTASEFFCGFNFRE